jgi:hypothetical protein
MTSAISSGCEARTPLALSSAAQVRVIASSDAFVAPYVQGD